VKHLELLNEDVDYMETRTAKTCCNTCNLDGTGGCNTFLCGSSDNCGTFNNECFCDNQIEPCLQLDYF
jgi:hypothetical protein